MIGAAMRIAAGVMACAVAMPIAAQAQALSCALPASLPPFHAEGPSRNAPKRLMPTTGYTLAISWSPQFCRGRSGDARGAFQCDGTAGRFGFVLHGLWPDGADGSWPQYCRPARPVAERTLRANLCATPSTQLIQHEWAKHGTCMSASPDAYFDTSRRLYEQLRFPDMAAMARRRDLTVARFATAFAASNRGLTPAMLRIRAGRGGTLEEVWICLDTRLRYVTCKAGGTPRSAPLRIAPLH